MLVGGFVIYTFLSRRELLIEGEGFRLILGVSAALFATGIVLHFTEAGRYSMSGALLCPLLSLGLFRMFRRVFINRFKHEPRDTFFNWNPGLGEDRVFNIVYGVSAALLWMFVTFGMELLAKADW